MQGVREKLNHLLDALLTISEGKPPSLWGCLFQYNNKGALALAGS